MFTVSLRLKNESKFVRNILFHDRFFRLHQPINHHHIRNRLALQSNNFWTLASIGFPNRGLQHDVSCNILYFQPSHQHRSHLQIPQRWFTSIELAATCRKALLRQVFLAAAVVVIILPVEPVGTGLSHRFLMRIPFHPTPLPRTKRCPPLKIMTNWFLRRLNLVSTKW